MNSPRYQLDYIKASIDQLEDYLLSDLLYWPVGLRARPGNPAYPNLTLGNLLLFLHQAAALSQDAENARRLAECQNDLDMIRTRWSMHWQKKAGVEVQARVKLWRDFLQEYRKDPEGNYDRYEYEVTRRVMLEWLMVEAGSDSSPESELLKSMDGILKSLLVGREFIWEKELQPEFPHEVFWYLYGRLPESWPAPT